MPSAVLDAEALYNTLRNGPPQARLALLEQLPDSGFGEAALLLRSDQPGMIVCGITTVVMKLCAGIDPGAGKPLALAAHRYAVEVFEQSPAHGGLLPMTLTNLAYQYVNACNLLGDSEATLAFAERWIPYYTALGEPDNLPSLKAARINALINLHRLDDAHQALDDPTLRGNVATDIEIARLERLLRERRGGVTEDREAVKAQQAQTASQGILTEEVKKAVTSALDMAFGDSSRKPELADALAKLLADAKPTDAGTRQGFDSLIDALKIGERVLTGGQSEVGTSEITVRQKVREIDRLFVGGGQPGAPELQRALGELEPCLQWAQAQDHTELKRDILWRIYLCRGRLNQPSEAADAALALRADLEEDRAGIQDPLRRGGVFSAYPHLFSALCEKLHLAGRAAELLEAIEASKGRGVADILTKKAGKPIADSSVNATVQRLPELTRKHAFHYVTFHVDDEQTYIALVSKAGEIRAVPPAPVGRSTIRDAALHGDPTDLAPLVEWIAEFEADGVIEPGDHICYAPDEELTNVPLHYLLADDKPVIDRVSVSRIHSAFHLAHVLETPAKRPSSYIGFVVPLKENVERSSWPELQRLLREPIGALQKLKGQSVEETDATLEYVRAVDLRRQVLHFSAHGLFPGPETGRAPFQASGIVLASRSTLPEAEQLEAGDLSLVLTPSNVLDLKLDLTGSHVSIMTCVSGLSREGIGGDALGLDWAFTQAGAASLLTSHWNVDARVAAPFVRKFYELWLGKRNSRAKALAQVMTAFRAQADLFGQPRSWAAFSLTGDWR